MRLAYNCCVTGTSFVEGKQKSDTGHKNGIKKRSNLKNKQALFKE